MERKIHHGILHVHSENSTKDSTATVKGLVWKAKSLGSPAIMLSDHGVMTGIFELLRAVKKVNDDPEAPYYGIYDIKAIPGVEAYVQEDSDARRKHLLLIAKDYQGYKAICRAVTKSNTNINGDKPCMTIEMLRDFFAPGTPGHGHVIATSACAGGVLAQVLLKNSTLLEEIDKIKRKQSRYNNPEDASYQVNLKLLDQYQTTIKELMARRDQLKKTAEMKFGKWERTVAKLNGIEKAQAESELAAKKRNRDLAAAELPEVKSEIAKMKRRETATRQACREAEKSHEKWRYYQSEINTLTSALCDDTTLYNETKSAAKEYLDIFGTNHFYIELQYHGIQNEAKVMPKLAQLAKDLCLPVVATNDIHYINNSPEDVRARALVSAMRFNKWNPEQEGDREYYIKTDAELREWLSKILDSETVNAAMRGISDIVDKCNVTFPSETHFPKFEGGVPGESAKDRLRRLTEEGIKRRYPDCDFKYRDRVEYELSIIDKMQYNDYLCIVQDFLTYARQKGLDCPEGVGYVVGPGRGSAAGSLVCYLIGITSIDPMPLNLLFERFLNPDRISSPDIDVDLAYEVREETLKYVRQKYGEDAICCIMTKGTLAAKNAIKSVARVRGSELHDDKMAFYDLGNEIAKLIPAKDLKATLQKYESQLREAFEGNAEAQAIISDAMLVEGTVINYGMHPAGVIIADNGDVGEYIPLMWNDEKARWCTQCDMVESEMQAGLLKFDFLGLRNLDIITETLRRIKRNTGKSIDIEQIPQESCIYREVFAAGKTDFVFQFSSDGMKNLLRRFKPENLEHLMLLNAVFRPGPLQYADAICDIKSGKKKPSYICEEAKDILSVTYGNPVYQEQIMQLCNRVAGFTLSEADLVRRYMSKKKEKELAKFRPQFVAGLIDKGVTNAKAEAFWKELMEFGKYCFNKSHAAVYATIAYYTAWLKYHYPTEYMTAILNKTSIDELSTMIKECKALGIKVIAPDINRSEEGFTGKDGLIQFGLGNIKSVGKGASDILAERNANGEYRSFKDLLVRVRPSQGICETLIDAGTFDCWCENRSAMKSVLKSWLHDIEKIDEKSESEKEIDAAIEKARIENDEKETAKLQKKLLDTTAKKEAYLSRFNCAVLPVNMPEDKTTRLAIESELLGMYISGHPIDEYPDAKKLRSCTIAKADCNGQFITLCGIVRKLYIARRKKDGAPMAFFTLEDETGSAEGCCFTRAYEDCGAVLAENAIVAVKGRLTINEDDETERIIKKISVEDAQLLQPKPKKLLISTKDLPTWTDLVYPQIVPYTSETGSEVVLYDLSLGEFRTTTLLITKDILLAEIDGAEIKEVDI